MRIFLLLAAIAISFWSCDNTLNTNAPFKEIMVVYGALNKADSLQVIRVQRAFLNAEENVYELAQVTDSIYFRNLQVKIEDNLGNTFNFAQNSSFIKDTGLFTTDGHVVYTAAINLRMDREYFLTVTNPESGVTGTGRTLIVDDAESNVPSTVIRQLDFDSSRNFIIRFTSGIRARVYDATLRFFYEEYDISTNNLLGLKYVDWNFIRNQVMANPNAKELVNFQRPGQVFYDFVGGAIPVNPNVYRKAIGMTFYIWGGDSEYFTYIDVNRPQTGIVQKLPEYSNIGGGHLGIFASRNSYNLDNITLSARTLEHLRVNSATQKLNFR